MLIVHWHLCIVICITYLSLAVENVNNFTHIFMYPNISHNLIVCCVFVRKNDENITVCMDGNFGLVRKKNAGTSPMPPDHDGIYFVPHEEVNDFCSSYYEGKEKDQVRNFKIFLMLFSL